MAITRDDIEQLIAEVLRPSVELHLYPESQSTTERPFRAVLASTGGWHGHIVLEATDSFARAVAAKMFGMPRHEVSHDDAIDSVAELANVLGGNLKSMLGDTEVDLGLPQAGATLVGGSEVARGVMSAGPGFDVVLRVVEGASTEA